MNANKFKILIVLIICTTLFIPNIYAQKSKEITEKTESKAFQLTFIYPLGINGSNAYKYTNDISLNLLGGFNGGVNILELSAFVNINYGNVYGFQGAGFSNVNIGKTNGVQAAGFVNTTSDSFTGAQLAGFTNFSKGVVKGTQIAGFTNITKDIDGLQISGFLNAAKKVKGVQLGFINIADSIDGMPIGILSIVKHGYYRFEFGASESFFANVSFKIGVEHFYNIFTTCFKRLNDDIYWSYGYGVGTLFALGPKMNINIDITCQQVNENEWNTTNLNILNTLKLNVSYKLTDQIELIAGPSYNVMVSEFDFREGIGSNSNFVPWSFYDKNYDNLNIKMFAGFNAALRF